MKPKMFLLLLSLYIVNCTLYISHATTRYVSKTGSSTPPYTSWETAADSIQNAINIAEVGDTIYVANGVYKEQVIMIPGLSLIGAGMDSCVIDTRELVTTSSFRAVQVADSCLFQGFYVIVYQNSDMGRSIYGLGNCSIIQNRVINGISGITAGTNGIVYKNISTGNRIGIYVTSSNAIVRCNNIYHNYPEGIGISISASNYSYTPLIDSNYIETNEIGIRGIDQLGGARPIIANNTIVMRHGQWGISLYVSDSAKVYNNLIYAESGVEGIRINGVPYIDLQNNYVTGNLGTGIVIGPAPNVAKHNVVTGTNTGIAKYSTEPNPLIQYNNVWNTNTINYSNFTPDSTNLSVDPMIVNDDTTQGELDFHLQKYSPLIDAGDPNMKDKDSSRIDIGLYGGLYGEVYNYQDLAPRPPRNLIAVYDSAMITVKWNRNTEADFSEYKLFRDTVAEFTADSTTLVLSLTDTAYSHLTPPDVETYYYKLIAVDNQGNESKVSEEIAVKITSVNDDPITISDYRLYQNYPNPFNPSTTIGYRLKESGYVKLYVYDIKGEQIAVLVNQYQAGGYYEVEFNSSGIRNQVSGISDLSSGVYIYQLMVKSDNNIPVFSDIKKFVIVK
ncbi:MAG: right-handed parallel beta-helix repeat-containing protein [Ignavibacteriales bacterium]|nr:MAG: right-handed parallel beta-helix repeat-containing protein [Ignavibacteriales bacterium]